MYIKGKTSDWECVIGLEVHTQILSNTKLFSSAAAKFGGDPNENVSLIDAAMPGMLPVLNSFCIEQGVKTSLGINAKVHNISIFDRKNYFYPDLPQGYQISQFYHPLATQGHLDIKLEDGSTKTIRINRLHLEQDAGKSIHDQSNDYSFIDLNRSGIALMEIVSEPDMRSAYEVTEYVKKLRNILRYLDTSDGDMEKGSLRCDINVSVRKIGAELGTRCEIKNVNSIRNITVAIEYESRRQVEILENGGRIVQETRLFDATANTTRTMRTKEEAHDYRYFPDPDLLPVKLEDSYIDNIKSYLPELPDQKLKKYINMGLNEYDANILVSDKNVALYFEELMSQVEAKIEPKIAANWIITEIFGAINRSGIKFEESKITAQNLQALLVLLANKTISGKIAKSIFEEMFSSGKNPSEIVKEKNLNQISDSVAIEQIITQVLQDKSESVEAYKQGKVKLFGFFIGEVMKKTEGKANPEIVNDILRKKLDIN